MSEKIEKLDDFNLDYKIDEVMITPKNVDRIVKKINEIIDVINSSKEAKANEQD